MHRIILIFGILCITLSAQAQTDTEFWFAAPDLSETHGDAPDNGAPFYLHMSAIYATTITVSRPSDPTFTDINIPLAQGEAYSIRLDNLLPGLWTDIEVSPGSIQQKGFRITSTSEITAFYELNNRLNRDIMPLKGTNALGTEFTVTTQNIFPNGYTDSHSGFVVVATESNTVVTVDLPAGVDYVNHIGGGTVTITLPNPGDAYAFEAVSRAAVNHPQGIKVTTNNKNIAISVYDDSMARNSPTYGSGTCLDTYADQIVPDYLLGNEYIVMSGRLSTRAEMIFVTAILDNTDIFIDGSALPIATLNEGDVFEYVITNRYTNVYGSNPISVTHITGTGNGCEQGGAYLPTIDGCTGSYDVTFAHSNPVSDLYNLNIMVRNNPSDKADAINHFILNVGGTTTPIPSNFFEFSTDSTFAFLIDDWSTTQTVYNWIINNIPANDPPTVATISNPTARFHLGVLQGMSNTGAKYGYFSDYAGSRFSAGIGGAYASKGGTYCNLDPFQVVATGALEYTWEATMLGVGDVTNKLSDIKAAAPYFDPDTAGFYEFHVTLTGECEATDIDTLLAVVNIGPTSNFTLSKTEGCSPFTTTITNTTDSTYAGIMEWLFLPSGEFKASMPTVFDRTYTNKTDTAQTYSIRLTSKTKFGTCANTLERNVTVLPEVNAGFLIDTLDTGCHPWPVTFNNTSTGHLDSTSYFWDFGDNSNSFDSLPSHTFNNYTNSQITYDVKLAVTSPLHCSDTADTTITVYPRIQAQFSLDTNNGCSPFTFNLNPSGSIGIDTLRWLISSADSNYIYTKTKPLTSISHTHRDTTYSNGPDTLQVMAVGKNQYGCVSNSVAREVIVFPEIISKLSVDKNIVCDSVPVLFSNLSEGNNLKFEWNFGDYTYRQDSTMGSHRKIYLNRNDSTINYTTTLKAISEYKCVSLSDTTVAVRPYLNAGFGLGYINNCSPLDVTFNNTSTRVSDYIWDMGDGTTYTYDTMSFTHRFINSILTSDTTFTIKLIGSNPEGCTDTTSRSLFLYQPVVANFGLSENIGCSPIDIGISNTSTGNSLIYTWDFGDGISSTNNAALFTKQFNNFSPNDTTYTITLLVKNLAGCDSTISKDVDVMAYIDADFSLPVVDSCSPLQLRIKNLSSPGSKIANWNFGNGQTSTDINPVSPVYTNLNTTEEFYDVSLITYGVEDALHRTCADTMIIPITIFPELQASFSLSDTVGCQPLISAITNTSTPSSGTNYTWNLNNGFYSPLANPGDLDIPNLSDVDSTHTLWLYGRTKFGCRDTASHTFTVHSLVDAYFTLDKPEMCSGDSFLIDRAGTKGGISDYFWDYNGEFNDSRTDNPFYISYENLNATNQSKYVSLRVENSAGCDSTWSESITVFPKVVAEFDPDFNEICYPHSTVFTNNSTNAKNYIWDFGDGTNSTENTPTHLYKNLTSTTNLTHDVKLIAKSSALCIDSITKQVTIYAKPVANFDFPVSVDCPPFLAEMQNMSSGINLTYNWNFAGEGSSSDTNAFYTFVNDSNLILEKPITLIVTSENNCKDTLLKLLSVYPDPKISFEASVLEGCSPLNIDFTGNTKNILQMQWYIDNSIAFSTISDPSYRFENELPTDQQHEIKFWGRSQYGCTDSAQKIITIYPNPIAEFIPEPSPVDYNTELDYTTITFFNETRFHENWDYTWSYGDGIVNQDARKENDYNYGYMIWGDINNHNQIPVQMIAFNRDHSECNDTANHMLIINPPIPQVDLAEDIEGCAPFTINFGSITKYNYDDQYDWDFGVTGATSTVTTPTYTFADPGVYPVKLTVYGDGGLNYDVKIITVNPKPTADFSFSDSLVFDSSQTKGYDWIDFYNHSKFASKYRWYFDSEELFEEDYYFDTIPADSYKREPRWFYGETGEYYVTLIAESSKGCLDTLKNYLTPIQVVGEGTITFPTGFFVNPTTAPPSEYDTDQRKGNLYLFYPRNIGVTEYKLEIYNKWGVLLFETDDVNRGWNGYIDGIPAKQDVYVWRAKGIYTNGQKFSLSGDVTLIRTEVNVTN